YVYSMYAIKLIFFFSSRRRHTRCSRDWSSDVCSSDLLPGDCWIFLGVNLAGLYSFRQALRHASCPIPYCNEPSLSFPTAPALPPPLSAIPCYRSSSRWNLTPCVFPTVIVKIKRQKW